MIWCSFLFSPTSFVTSNMMNFYKFPMEFFSRVLNIRKVNPLYYSSPPHASDFLFSLTDLLVSRTRIKSSPGLVIQFSTCSLFAFFMWILMLSGGSLSYGERDLYQEGAGIWNMGREGAPGCHAGLKTHHCAVKSTNSGEKRSAGSWGDGSSTTCFSCWNGVPQDSYGNRRMAISICRARKALVRDTQKQDTGGILQNLDYKRVKRLTSYTYQDPDRSQLWRVWLTVFKPSEFIRFYTQVPAHLEKFEEWACQGLLPICRQQQEYLPRGLLSAPTWLYLVSHTCHHECRHCCHNRHWN